jgi:hypothetical protein
MVKHGASKIALQWYSKCYSVASVTKTFTLKDVQTIYLRHLERCIVCTTSSINIFSTLTIQQHLEYLKLGCLHPVACTIVVKLFMKHHV